MKKKEQFEEEINLTPEEIEEAKGLKNVRTASVFIVIFSLVCFLIITYFTGFIGEKFGAAGENISLGIIGLLLILAWYKNNKNN